jgi:thiosulfate/3-mercaptopyruvate sulfurtransferase
MKNTRFLAGSTILALALGPCVFAQSAPTARDAMVVSPAWLAQHAKDPDLVLLHLGVKTDYDAAHIPGARFITLADIAVSDTTGDGLSLQMPAPDDLHARLEKIGVSDSSRIVVSYAKDRIASATRVLFTLDYAGLGRRASLLDGGHEAWVREGRPVTSDVPPAISGKLSPLTVRASTIVDAAYVNAHLTTPGTVIIDARLPAFYNGTQTGGNADKPHKTGHIPSAQNVPYVDTLNTDGTLKPADVLKAMFDGAGVKSGDTVVAYCHIGQQATAVVFAARTLGLNVLLYDGSFEDWSRHPELPVTIKK